MTTFLAAIIVKVKESYIKILYLIPLRVKESLTRLNC
jgi:hypothetical protein